MRNHQTVRALILSALLLTLAACATVPPTDAGRQDLIDGAQNTIRRFMAIDPDLTHFFQTAYGYAVFPNVGKGGLGLGGAYGRGIVYQNGKMTGYCDLTQGSIGAQIGGQTYSEVIFFQSKTTYDQFTSSQFVLAAGASAIVAKSGAAASADYQLGVLVFTQPDKGFMFEASVGGQEFTYEPR